MRYKSEDELITSLKETGKYDEWVSLGSYFGLRGGLNMTKAFMQRTYKYYDMNGEVVYVYMIQKKYRDEVENIPVFKQIVVHDPTNVEQSKFRIVDRSEVLSTAGLATCTGLAMIVGNKKFMAHLDAVTKTQPIEEALRKLIHMEEVSPADLRPFIYAGSLNSQLTLQNTIDICSAIGISREQCYIATVCFMERVYI